MFNYKKQEIVALAKENGFKSETLEKVLRLIDVLDFINKSKEYKTIKVKQLDDAKVLDYDCKVYEFKQTYKSGNYDVTIIYVSKELKIRLKQEVYRVNQKGTKRIPSFTITNLTLNASTPTIN